MVQPVPSVTVPDTTLPVTTPSPTVVPRAVVVPGAQSSAAPEVVPPKARVATRPAAKANTAPAKAATETRTSPSAATPANSTADLPAAPANTNDAVIPAPVVAPVAPIAAPAAATPVAQTDNGSGLALTIIALLIAFALAVIGFMAFRRRNPAQMVAPSVERPRVTAKPVLTAQPAVSPVTATTRDASFPAFHAVPQPVKDSAKPLATRSTGNNRGAVALPRKMPETFEERDALIKRMVEAAPDRANPFRSRKARLHRARLILQSLGQSFTDRDPWIDLSEYPDNWPELARKNFSHAA